MVHDTTGQEGQNLIRLSAPGRIVCPTHGLIPLEALGACLEPVGFQTSSKRPEGTRSANVASWSVNVRERSLGAETMSGLGVHTTGLPEYMTRREARSLTAAARCTLRSTPHTHTRAEPDTTERSSKEH
ncbi:hypothetical protein EVAR_23306_1 [Eumeta japonica]|uniref:Uncharacterized protein n=1 Tax=Eumeta variegata TaxID=151549 RepID=A0A4C1Y175_EUMVA|nr:hypothetical protein EVAR_23306_1 [Eumeta japonica]